MNDPSRSRVRFSVVSSCVVADSHLRRTADSIFAQSYREDHIDGLDYIVVCADTSGRSDDLLCELQSRGARVLNEADRSLYDGLAKGFALARGEVVSYLNAGDIYYPEAFSILDEVFALDRVGWITGYATLCNVRSQKIAAWKPAPFDRDLFSCGAYCSDLPRHPWVQQESTFWKRELFDGLDWETFRSFRLAGDHYLWLHLSQLTDLYSVHGFLGSFLCNPGQMSSDRQAYIREIQPYFRPPTFGQKLKMWADFRASWKWKVKADRLLRGRTPNRVIQFSPELDKWCVVE